MKRTTTPKKGGAGKWLGYSSMATAFLAVAPSAKAQVVSVDIVPDTVLDGATYDVDLDGDGTVDISIIQTATASSSEATPVIGVYVPTGNAVLGSVSAYGNYMYPYVLAAGDPISVEDPNFQTGSFGSLYYGSNFGNWGDQSGFLGCRFLGGDGMTHYGWVQLSVPANSDSVTVMAYGYETSPAGDIAAGAVGPTGISDNGTLSPWGVVANPVTDQALVNLPRGTDAVMKISLLSSTGQVLFTDEVQGVQQYSLPMEGQAPGVYFLRVQQGKRVGFRKVAKQ